MTSTLKILVIERDGHFIAQSLEKHIVVQAPTLEELPLFFIDTLMTYAFLDEIEGLPPLSRLKGAPIEVWRQWESAQPMKTKSDPKFDFRQAA